MPYATKTATLTGIFRNQPPPSAVTVTAGGIPVPYTNLRATVLSGSGVRTAGIISVDVVPPAAGSVTYTITPVGAAGNAVPGTFTARIRPAGEAYQVPAAIPFGLMSHGAAAPVGTLVETWPAFPKGYLRADQHLVLTVDGQSVPIQQDSESPPWGDGTVWGARTVWPMPVALAADTEKRMTVSVAAGAPDRTPHMTPAAIVAAHDHTLRASGGLLGATVLTASLRDIVTNYPRDAWGTNPLGGWDVPVSGPYQVIIRAWRYVDAWHKFWIYLTANSDGTTEIAGNLTGPNFDGAVPNAPAGPTSGTLQDQLVCAVEAFRDGVRVAAWGGANDPRAAQYAAASLFAGGVVTLPDTFGEGMCVVFTAAAGGTLPSGITAGTPYWLGTYNYQPYSLHTARGNCQNGLNPVAFGTGGSGNIVVTPLMSVHGFSGLALMAPDGRAVRIGGGRVDLAPNWDEGCMSRGAKLFPCYPKDASLVRYSAADSGTTTQPYYPLAAPWRWWLNDYGDDPPDDRVDYLNNTQLRALLLPYDAVFNQEMRRRAACWVNQPIWAEDVASGRLVVCDNGPDRAGGRYLGMGPSRPGNDWNHDLPAAVAGTAGNFSGYISGYSRAPIEGSHMPAPWVMAAHRTGHPLYADCGAAQANASQMSGINMIATIQGRTYYNVLGGNQQLRGSGWVLRTWDYAEAFTAASRPEAAYVAHMLDEMAKWGAHHVLAAGAADLKMGRVGHLVGNDDVGFFLFIFSQALMMGVWRGRRPQLRTYAAAIGNVLLGMINDGRADGGSSYIADTCYHPHLADAQGVAYPDLRTMIASEADFGHTSPPYPATGFRNGSFTDNTNAFNTVNYGTLLRMAVALAASGEVVSLEGDDAGLVYALFDARLNTPPCTGIKFSVPAWSNTGRFGVKMIYAGFSAVPG